MALDHIVVRGAREHNLKNVDVQFPRDRLVVITGLSGSGKSSLAFDTIYAEGQRRYVESLSAYARQFLGLMEKPDVDYIDGLSPAISIEQRTTSRNPRSTVGTVTEVYDYLRLFFARIGTPYCHRCGREISRQTVQQMTDQIMDRPEGTAVQIMAPLVRGRKGEYKGLFDRVQKEGYVRVRVDGKLYPVEKAPALEKNRKHTIEVVVDRLKMSPKVTSRLTDSLETALNLGSGIVVVEVQNEGDVVFSEHFACLDCGISIEEITPRMFSFNNPYGACPTCSGLGTTMDLDPERIVPDRSKSLDDGAIATWGSLHNSWYSYWLTGLARHYGFSLKHPFGKLPEKIQDIILYGSGDEEIQFDYQHSKGKGRGVVVTRFEGVVPNLARRYKQTSSTHIRTWVEGFMSVKPCPDCRGARLKPASLAVKVSDQNIYELTRLSIKTAKKFFERLTLTPRQLEIARQILKEIRERLGFLENVGLDYLTLDRNAGTLSGGEAERIRLATQIGSSLMGVLYILDEPSIGLHQRDNNRLLDTLCRLRDMGNTVLVVEHDRATIERADYVIDLGPGAGVHGGRVVAQGPPEVIKKHPKSLTGAYLTGRAKIPVPENRRASDGRSLLVKEARANNLKSIDVAFPLGLFICVTGVSGSGKSTLVNEILYKWLARYFYNSKESPGACSDIEGVYYIDKVICIDQNPIGRTPRSNPATYTGLFTHIRDMFAQVPDSKTRGYRPGRFSFNVKGGRCEACQGDGIIKIEMHFLPDVYVPCEVCKGKRYNRETLEITYRRRNIAEVLDMTVEEALSFFENIPAARRKLETLFNVGLGYIKLGQPATTLSGGEAQRVKLATELSKMSTGRTLYILDEPTTGLHFEDIKMLLDVLNKLVDMGNTVVVIEHNLDVIKTADYIVDLGPEGGDDGGWVVKAGPPEDVAREKKSYTGRFIRKELAQGN